MRITLMILWALAGYLVGDCLGTPSVRSFGDPQQVYDWALWTGSCSAAGATAALFYPLRRKR